LGGGEYPVNPYEVQPDVGLYGNDASDSSQSEPIITTSGATVDLPCRLDASAVINWRKEGGSLPDNAVQVRNILRIQRVTESDSGRYICTCCGGRTQYVNLNVERTGGRSPTDGFAANLDSNNDGFVSRDEMPGDLPDYVWAGTMNVFDTNRDGRISLPEYSEGVRRQEQADRNREPDDVMMARVLDKNLDGFLSREEVPGMENDDAWAAVKNMIDTDRDGRISLAEYADFARSQRAAQGSPGQQVDMALSAMDTNRDGFLDRSELPGNIPSNVWEGMLNSFDANNDRKLSISEYKRGTTGGLPTGTGNNQPQTGPRFTPPTIEFSVSSTTNFVGGSLDLRCMVTGSSTNISWTKLDGEFEQNVRNRDFRLRIDGLTKNNEGVYRCTVETVGGEFTKDYELSVDGQ